MWRATLLVRKDFHSSFVLDDRISELPEQGMEIPSP